MRTTTRPTSRTAWALAPAGGAILGAAAKLADESGIPGVGDLGSYFGLWIVIASLTAAWSPSRWMAALRVGALMFAMVLSYYTITLLRFGHFPTSYFITWAAAAVLVAPLFAVLTWSARAQGWMPAIAAALPIGLLLAEAYSFRWVLSLHPAPFVFDIAAAALLLVVLAKGWSQRARVLVLVPLVVMAGVGALRALPYAAGVLRAFGLRL